MGQHSTVVGGSTAARVRHCQGSVRLARSMPRSPESEFAAEGTALHEGIAGILDQDFKEDRSIVGVTFHKHVITEAMFEDAIKPALAYFDSLMKEFDEPEFAVEQRVAFEGIEGAFGTADVIMRAPDRSVVLDWKFGRGVPVSAEDNDQLKFYAYAGLTTPDCKDLFEQDDDWPVELFIVQPRVEDGNSRWLTSVKQLKAFARDLKHAVKKAEEPDAHFELGPWCRFCPAKPACPLLLDKVDEAMAANLEELGEDVADWLQAAEQLDGWIRSVRELAHERLESGQAVPGWKLVAKRASRFWKDEKAAQGVLRRLGLKSADMFEKTFLSPAAAEKALKKIGAELDEKASTKLIDKKSSGNTLAREDDKRPAIVLPAKVLEDLGKRLGVS